ncbi:MAG: MFS transporter, partial [Ligilactobacillus sp.]|nr:MFS transporter [Ligilactobacillus sp.]
NWLLFGMGIFFIIGNKFGGYLADNGGLKPLRYVYITMTLLLLLLGSAIKLPWLGAATIALLCVCFASYGASTQLMFLEIAEKKYPQSLDLASSLNSIFANLGISLGSLTAAQTVEFTSLANVGYIGALYGLLATGLTFILYRDLLREN